jgi:adenine-specific DNA methylase
MSERESMPAQIIIRERLFKDFFDYKFPAPQYLGAKYKHLTWLEQYIPTDARFALDLFAGSQSVAYLFKQKGLRVYTNDFLSFNHQIGKGLIENKNITLDMQDIAILFSANSNPHYYKLMEKLYLDIFFTADECKFLDSFRSNLSGIAREKQSLALAIMNRSMTRKVTMGHFAHTRALDYANNPERIKRNRSLIRPIKDIYLELLPIYNEAVFDNRQENKSFNKDAIDLIWSLGEKIDLLYLDPPYCGSHPDYQAFYHLLETYTEYWQDKEFRNSTNRYFPKRASGFDTKKYALDSFRKLFEESRRIPYWLISYNDRSYPKQDVMLDLIHRYKKAYVVCKEYSNSVGGKGSVKGSKELLFVCAPK